MTATPESVARTLAYHERTKHHPHRYARALGYMDWDTQPDPFRTYAGAPRIDLPLTADGVETSYADLYIPGAIEPRALDAHAIGAFFELALGLTAWKEYGDSRWALRSDPSSGNLHPTEGYLVTPGIDGVPAGVHHYVSRDHCLEQRCALDPAAAGRLAQGLPDQSFLVGISSIHWREAWKYGERAFRYCQHDAGHVIGTLRFAAAALGWSARLVDGFGDEDVRRILKLSDEQPETFLLVTRGPTGVVRTEGLADVFASGSWAGKPNELSSEQVEWEVIDIVAEATRKPPSGDGGDALPRAARVWTPTPHPCTTPAATIIRQRRSAVSMDQVTSISRAQFYAVLERVLPGAVPFDALPWEPKVHLGIFVHRVDDLAPGLYLLERTADVHEHFVEQLGKKPLWSRPAGCPEHLRLYCISEKDVGRTAAAVSCGQDIAADGAFSLGMIAEFRDTVSAGAHAYRRLFWETGVIGQVLYLEAEAIGIRSTGIGCYFDDEFHRVLGLEGNQFQSLYHFTVGGPVEDTRLATHPAYAHLKR